MCCLLQVASCRLQPPGSCFFLSSVPPPLFLALFSAGSADFVRVRTGGPFARRAEW